ncbi:MAG: glycosyltransferase family 2 protein [Clostridiales bacterium]|nr:glycosyltransferase family 2 protein [Clostridiales bacterium]
MKVSIIIPIYNSENYLTDCIESAVSQTYSDIEIILVNDGSTDGSEEICRSYEEKDQRVRLINQSNAGVSAARNAGLDASTGDLIAFIDSDDSVENDYIEYLFDLMDTYGSDMTCCQYDDIENANKEPSLLQGPEACLKEYLISNDITVSVCCKLYKKHLFEGIRMPVGKRYEDNYVVYKLISKCKSVTVGFARKYHYYSNPSGFVNEPFSMTQMDIVDAALEQKQFIDQNYPALIELANSRIIYAANRCLTKMADSKSYNSECIKMLKPLYKEYGKDFLNGPSGRSAKTFSKIARISPRLAMHIYRLLSK